MRNVRLPLSPRILVLAPPSDVGEKIPSSLCGEEIPTVMATEDPRAPSDHLLRMLAAVPVSSQILDLGCGHGRHTEPLLRLGFPVHACDPESNAVAATRERVGALLEEGSAETSVQQTPLEAIEYPDATFNWVVAYHAERYVSTEDDLRILFEECRRVLTPGGWLYVTLPTQPSAVDGPADAFSIEMIEECRTAADLAEAREPTEVEGDEARIRALYRRVDPHTPA